MVIPDPELHIPAMKGPLRETAGSIIYGAGVGICRCCEQVWFAVCWGDIVQLSFVSDIVQVVDVVICD